ncbi:MAG: hypothetical protein M1833_003272 [Piccolia ochrophora]|nr:MAG: hypothetical protein M1833_003272 [Piccolia ochrophora]
MPLNYTAAHSSRVSKPKARTSPYKASSSHYAPNRRKPPSKSKSAGPDDQDEDDDDITFDDRLTDVGLVRALATDLSLRDVPQALRYIGNNMFHPIPDRASGLNSTRIAEILNFRRSLPPIVTVAHLHALLNAPTSTEREISQLTRMGVIRKTVVPGRGKGGADIGEGLVLMDDWTRLVKDSPDLEPEHSDKFVKLLRTNPTAQTLPRSLFTEDEARSLMQAGFLTVSDTSSSSTAQTMSRPGAASLGTLMSLSKAGSRSASGSLAAVGGPGIVHEVGGSGGGRLPSHQTPPPTTRGYSPTGAFRLSLPTTGPYLRLLTSARTHLMTLLAKSKHREAPLDILRERWDGGIARDDAAARAKKARAEFVGIVPARTRKWRQFYGLGFDWVLGECLGAGLVELFDTGSVGTAARAV